MEKEDLVDVTESLEKHDIHVTDFIDDDLDKDKLLTEKTKEDENAKRIAELTCSRLHKKLFMR